VAQIDSLKGRKITTVHGQRPERFRVKRERGKKAKNLVQHKNNKRVQEKTWWALATTRPDGHCDRLLISD
jgi:hypothetical protein